MSRLNANPAQRKREETERSHHRGGDEGPTCNAQGCRPKKTGKEISKKGGNRPRETGGAGGEGDIAYLGNSTQRRS